MNIRRFGAVGIVLLVIALALGALMAPAALAGEDDVCAGFDPGTVKIDAFDAPSVVVDAPDGFLIDGYCVKAGSIHNGFGPVFVPVDPPQASVTITYPGKDTISHYSVSYTPDVPEVCPEGTTGEFPDCEEPEEPEEPEVPEEPEDDVLGERLDRPSADNPEVAGERQGAALPFTGIDPAPFLALSGLLAASGLSALVISKRK